MPHILGAARHTPPPRSINGADAALLCIMTEHGREHPPEPLLDPWDTRPFFFFFPPSLQHLAMIAVAFVSASWQLCPLPWKG